MGNESEKKYKKGDGGESRNLQDGDIQCGYGNCKPTCLQTFNNPKLLLAVMAIFSLTHGFIVNGINNVNTQTYERRFGLSSADAGLISSAHEFSAAAFAIILAFFGSGRYKGRWLATGSILGGVGSLVMVLPHYITDLYDWGQYTEIPVCVVNSTIPEDCFDTNLRSYMGMLIGGMCLLGISSAIQYSIGIAFIDDSVGARQSPLYIGILYAVSVFGPGLGFVLGGRFLSIYVDFDKVDTDTVTLDDRDPRWVGAWWPPFFISMTLFFLSVVPLSLFGAELPTAEMVRQTRESQTHKASMKKYPKSREGKRQPIKSFVTITWSLTKNAPFTLLVLSATFRAFNIAGLATFIPKYFQNIFNLSPVDAAVFTGAIAVPGAVLGMFLGGLICNRMQLKVRGMIRLSIIASVCSIGFSTCLLLSCDKVSLAGITAAYEDAGDITETIGHGCNENCGCNTKYYRPVCAEDKLQYFSGCHAGCTRINSETQVFHNCTCPSLTEHVQGASVKAGVCDADCSNVYIFAVLLFCNTLCSFLVVTPGDASTLRCIDESERTYSMGLKHCIVRLLGSVPGPVVYGLVTDSSCLVWQSVCGDDTSCWIYNQGHVSRNYLLLADSMDLISVVFMGLALYVYTPPAENDEVTLTVDKQDSPGTVDVTEQDSTQL